MPRRRSARRLDAVICKDICEMGDGTMHEAYIYQTAKKHALCSEPTFRDTGAVIRDYQLTMVVFDFQYTHVPEVNIIVALSSGRIPGLLPRISLGSPL